MKRCAMPSLILLFLLVAQTVAQEGEPGDESASEPLDESTEIIDEGGDAVTSNPPPPDIWLSLGAAWTFDFDTMGGLRAATSFNLGFDKFHLGLGYTFTLGWYGSNSVINLSNPCLKIGARFTTTHNHFILAGVNAGLLTVSTDSYFDSHSTKFNLGVHWQFRFNAMENTYVHLDLGLDSFLYGDLIAYIGTGFSFRL